MSKPNPFCACGCGWEVSPPWNRWIMGHHNTLELSKEKRAQVKKLIDCGVSSYKIAKYVGRSQAAIENWKYSGIPQKRPAQRVLRLEDLERIAQSKEEYWKWRKGKRTLKEIQHLLRNRQPSRSMAYRQERISQIS